MNKATLIIIKDGSDTRAILTMGDNGQGMFKQQVEIYAYDNMAENKAKEIAGKLGWKIAE